MKGPIYRVCKSLQRPLCGPRAECLTCLSCPLKTLPLVRKQFARAWAFTCRSLLGRWGCRRSPLVICDQYIVSHSHGTWSSSLDYCQRRPLDSRGRNLSSSSSTALVPVVVQLRFLWEGSVWDTSSVTYKRQPLYKTVERLLVSGGTLGAGHSPRPSHGENLKVYNVTLM